MEPEAEGAAVRRPRPRGAKREVAAAAAVAIESTVVVEC